MVDDQQRVVCFRLASDYLIPKEACGLFLLSRYFAHHYLNDVFNRGIVAKVADQVVAQLPPEIELQSDLSVFDIFHMRHGFTNLLSNTCGLKGFNYWTKFDGGDGWSIGKWPEFRGNNSAFVSSNKWCFLRQTIDLFSRGYTHKTLKRAVIVAGAVMCARADNGGEGGVDLEIGWGPQSKLVNLTTGDVRCPMEGLVGRASQPITISIVEQFPASEKVVMFIVRGKSTVNRFGQCGTRFLHTFMYVVPIPKGRRVEDVVKVRTGTVAC